MEYSEKIRRDLFGWSIGDGIGYIFKKPKHFLKYCAMPLGILTHSAKNVRNDGDFDLERRQEINSECINNFFISGVFEGATIFGAKKVIMDYVVPYFTDSPDEENLIVGGLALLGLGASRIIPYLSNKLLEDKIEYLS